MQLSLYIADLSIDYSSAIPQTILGEVGWSVHLWGSISPLPLQKFRRLHKTVAYNILHTFHDFRINFNHQSSPGQITRSAQVTWNVPTAVSRLHWVTTTCRTSTVFGHYLLQLIDVGFFIFGIRSRHFCKQHMQMGTKSSSAHSYTWAQIIQQRITFGFSWSSTRASWFVTLW